MAEVFSPLPNVPDHPALEREVLERWEQERTFERLREQNAAAALQLPRRPGHGEQADGRPHRLGPHAQGRVPALQGARGFHQRYQNGWDCQGLWIEVGVEKSLGLELQARDRGVRARRVRRALPERVAPGPREMRSVAAAREWMDWGATTHVQRHQHRVHLALPRETCTSAAGSTRATARRSGARAAARRSRSTSRRARRTTASARIRRSTCASRSWAPGEALVMWTTTPWTLPANVAAAVDPDAEYGAARGDWRRSRAAG